MKRSEDQRYEGSLYYDLWLRQGRVCALSGEAISLSEKGVYVNSETTALFLEDPLADKLGCNPDEIESFGFKKVNLSATLGENTSQQVGDPYVW